MLSIRHSIWQFVGRALFVKIQEFFVLACISAALLYFFPGRYYDGVGLIKSAYGGLVFSGMFNVITLYPVASILLALVLDRVLASRKYLFEVLNTTFFLFYSGAWMYGMNENFIDYPILLAWMLNGFFCWILARRARL